MPTRKIADLPKPATGWIHYPAQRCPDPDHDPPSMVAMPPGVYEHECPLCGRKTVFKVGEVTFGPVGG